MSTLTMRNVDCPVCGSEQALAVWDSINVTLEPEMKAKFLSGDVFRFTCDTCKNQFLVTHPILYHDMEHGIMIWLLSSEEEAELQGINESIPNQGELQKRWRYRIVADINELIDKIQVLDSPYDDRSIEMLKYIMTKAIGEEMPEEEILSITYENNEKGQPCLVYLFEKGRAANLAIQETMIRKMQQDYGPWMEQRTQFGFQRIDQEWAKAVAGAAAGQ